MTRDLELPLPDLGLSAAEADERFARLQARLIPLWKSIQAFNVQEDGGVVEERIAGRDFRSPSVHARRPVRHRGAAWASTRHGRRAWSFT
jgi:hypothetical protein